LNFKLYILIIFFVIGCGVKSNPTAPTKESPPSLIQEILEENQKKVIKQKSLDN